MRVTLCVMMLIGSMVTPVMAQQQQQPQQQQQQQMSCEDRVRLLEEYNNVVGRSRSNLEIELAATQRALADARRLLTEHAQKEKK